MRLRAGNSEEKTFRMVNEVEMDIISENAKRAACEPEAVCIFNSERRILQQVISFAWPGSDVCWMAIINTIHCGHRPVHP